jgi:hypothetical protein
MLLVIFIAQFQNIQCHVWYLFRHLIKPNGCVLSSTHIRHTPSVLRKFLRIIKI